MHVVSHSSPGYAFSTKTLWRTWPQIWNPDNLSIPHHLEKALPSDIILCGTITCHSQLQRENTHNQHKHTVAFQKSIPTSHIWYARFKVGLGKRPSKLSQSTHHYLRKTHSRDIPSELHATTSERLNSSVFWKVCRDGFRFPVDGRGPYFFGWDYLKIVSSTRNEKLHIRTKLVPTYLLHQVGQISAVPSSRHLWSCGPL